MFNAEEVQASIRYLNTIYKQQESLKNKAMSLQDELRKTYDLIDRTYDNAAKLERKLATQLGIEDPEASVRKRVEGI